MQLPQAIKDLWADPKAHAVLWGGAAYVAPIFLHGFMDGSHMTQAQWDAFKSEAQQAWQHAAAAFALILPFVMAFVKAAREMFLAPPGHTIVPLPATQQANEAAGLQPATITGALTPKPPVS